MNHIFEKYKFHYTVYLLLADIDLVFYRKVRQEYVGSVEI
jgi:hypothetical protein